MGKSLNVRFPDRLYGVLSREADSENRSMGGQIRHILGLHYDGRDERRERGFADGRQEGFQDGRQEGFADGRQEGFEDGRKEGYKDGRQEGYREGREEGYQEGDAEEGLV